MVMMVMDVSKQYFHRTDLQENKHMQGRLMKFNVAVHAHYPLHKTPSKMNKSWPLFTPL